MSSASAHVRNALDTLERRTDAFNDVIERAVEVYQRRGDVIFGQLGLRPGVTNWAQSELVPLFRHRFDELFTSGPIGTPLAAAALERFTAAWDSDPDITGVTRELAEADTRLREALDTAISEIEKAMRRIAKQHESEPED